MKFVLLIFFFFIHVNGLFAIERNGYKTLDHVGKSVDFSDTLKNGRLLDTVDVTRNYKTYIVDSLQKISYATAYDILSNDPNFRFTDEKVYYQGKLLDIIKINGQVFKFRSPVELLKMFPSSILSSFSLNPYTDPLNSFWGNNNKEINSLDLRTPSGEISGILGNGNLKYNFRKKFDWSGNTILFKNNRNFVADFNLNNNAWDWGRVVDDNLNKVINGNLSIQNNTKLKNGELNFNFSFRKNQTIIKDYFADTVVVIDDNTDNSMFERIRKNAGQNVQFNSSLNKFYEKIYFDVTSNFQYSRSVNSLRNLNELRQEFRSNDSTRSSSYNGSFNFGYRFYKDKLFIVTSASFSHSEFDGQNQITKNTTENFVLNNSANNFFQPKVALKFNIDKVFLGDIYYNFSNSLSSSGSLTNNYKRAETFLENHIAHTGVKLRYTKTLVDFNTNIYYEKFDSRFENNSDKFYLDQNRGILHSSSATIRLLKSKLISSISLSRSLVYPSIVQKNPTNAIVTDTYASIGNPNLKNQSLLNFNWNANYQLKNSDNLSVSFSKSINKNKIVENLLVLQNDTVIAGVDLVKGVRLLTYSNSLDNRSPNTTISVLYSKSKFLIDNLSLQNTFSYSANMTERLIDTKSFADDSKGYSGNISMNYLKEGFAANTSYNFSLINNRFSSVGNKAEDENIRTISHNLITNLRVRYFSFADIEVNNSYDAVRYSSSVFENSHTDLVISQKYLKGKLELKLSIFDLFNQMRQNNVVKNDFLITRKARTDLVGRYFMLNLVYRFQNLKS